MTKTELEQNLDHTLTALRRQVLYLANHDTLSGKTDKRELATGLFQLEMWTNKAIRELLQTYTEPVDG